MGTTHASRLGIGPVNRALVIVTLAIHALLSLWVIVEQPTDIVGYGPVAAAPAVLFALERRPGWYRLTALILALGYGAIAVVALGFGGLLFAPTAALLTLAAILPALGLAGWAIAGLGGMGVLATALIIVALL